MKRLMRVFLVLIQITLGSAQAESLKPMTTTVPFEQVGIFNIRVRPQIDNQPFVLTLNLKCQNDPKVLKRLLTKKVCEYRGYTEDKANKRLILHYSTYNDVSDGRPEAHCDQSFGYIVDLKLECDQRKP